MSRESQYLVHSIAIKLHVESDFVLDWTRFEWHDSNVQLGRELTHSIRVQYTFNLPYIFFISYYGTKFSKHRI